MTQSSRHRPSTARPLVARIAFAFLIAGSLVLAPAAGYAAKKQEVPAGPPPPQFSKPVQKLLKASQDAFDKQDMPTSTATAKEALAAATTNDDKSYAMRFIYRAAVTQKDWTLALSSLKDYLASGLATPEEVVKFTRVIAQISTQQKDYVSGLEWYQKYLEVGGAAATLEDYDTAASIALNQKQPLLAAQIVETFRQRRGDDAMDERMWLRLNAAYYRAEKNQERRAPMQQLVVRYPKPAYMHDLLNLMIDVNTDDRSLANAFRFAYARGLLSKQNQYFDFAERLLNQGAPAEALDVLEQGVASEALKPSDSLKSLTDQAKPAAAEDRRTVAALDKEARGKQNGEMDVKLGLAYIGLKQYDKAVEAIRRGLLPERVAKVKRVDESNVLLGYSLYRLGLLDEAKAAFLEAGKDKRSAEVAALWLSATVPAVAASQTPTVTAPVAPPAPAAAPVAVPPAAK